MHYQLCIVTVPQWPEVIPHPSPLPTPRPGTLGIQVCDASLKLIYTNMLYCQCTILATSLYNNLRCKDHNVMPDVAKAYNIINYYQDFIQWGAPPKF
jgi:hypothetical protein